MGIRAAAARMNAAAIMKELYRPLPPNRGLWGCLDEVLRFTAGTQRQQAVLSAVQPLQGRMRLKQRAVFSALLGHELELTYGEDLGLSALSLNGRQLHVQSARAATTHRRSV